MLLAVDPGLDSGWAVFDSQRRLVACGLGDPDSIPTSIDLSTAKVLIECEQLRGRGEKNPNSILLMARTAGEWAGAFRKLGVTYLTPGDWKGSTPKPIDHARTMSRLDGREVGILDACFKAHPGRKGMAAGKRHNVLDAIGVGLFGVGRGR